MEERWGRALPERLCSTLPANAEDDPLRMVFMGGNSRPLSMRHRLITYLYNGSIKLGTQGHIQTVFQKT